MNLTIAVISKTTRLDDRFCKTLEFGDEVLVVSGEPIPSVIRDNKKNKFIYHPLDNNFSQQRNFALSKASGDWVLFVDSDEIVSSQLIKEIANAIKTKEFSGYYLKRIDTCFHQVQLHGETGNTKIIRLAKRKSGKFQRSVHEQWEITGKIGELENPLYHTKDHFISEFLNRISLYGPIDAITLKNEGKPFNIFRLLAYPKAKFILNYIIKLGFLDGYPGVFLAYLMAVQSLSVRIFQWTFQKRSTV